MPKYTVKSPLNHDGEEYAIGATVEMDERSAAQLVGTVEAAVEPPPPAGPIDPVERLAAVKGAIDTLDPNDKTAWTRAAARAWTRSKRGSVGAPPPASATRRGRSC